MRSWSFRNVFRYITTVAFAGTQDNLSSVFANLCNHCLAWRVELPGFFFCLSWTPCWGWTWSFLQEDFDSQDDGRIFGQMSNIWRCDLICSNWSRFWGWSSLGRLAVSSCCLSFNSLARVVCELFQPACDPLVVVESLLQVCSGYQLCWIPTWHGRWPQQPHKTCLCHFRQIATWARR